MSEYKKVTYKFFIIRSEPNKDVLHNHDIKTLWFFKSRIYSKYFYDPDLDNDQYPSSSWLLSIAKTVSNDDSKKVYGWIKDLCSAITFTDKLILSRHIIILSSNTFQRPFSYVYVN